MNESYQAITLNIDHRGVATIGLNRPEKHHALNQQMIVELQSAAQQLSTNESVRVVILSSSGKSFCAGGDLGWMGDQMKKDRQGKIKDARLLANMLNSLDTLPKPLIGRIQGNAYGGGVGMISVCDITIACEDVKFALTETRLGLIPATIGPYIVRRLGEGNARRVFMNSKVFSAKTAQELGLVSEVCSADYLDQAIESQVSAFLNCAPQAVSDAKLLCLTLARHTNGNQKEITATALADRWESKEAVVGISAFFEKRKPPWIDD